MNQKSYDGKNALYLIPTPIGNMEDITIRAVQMLKEVDVLFSEDTRVTSELLRFLDIKKRCIASHKFNEETNQAKLLEFLKKGMNVGIVTDRGTPIISDPGSILVKAAIDHHFHVIALPGATAFVPALIASGISAEKFYFYGFLNSKEAKRKKELKSLCEIKATLIFYEAPHRIEKTLQNMIEILGNRRASISREITKKFEEIYRGTLQEIEEKIHGAKGEFVIIVEGNTTSKSYNHLTVIEHVNLYIKEGLTSREAIKKVAKDRNVPKTEIYHIYHSKGE